MVANLIFFSPNRSPGLIECCAFGPDDTLVQLKSLEALKDIANGEANKVFIPFEATSTLSSLGAIKEVMKDDKKDKKND